MIGRIQCVECKHLTSGKLATCKAYPNGIPPEILDGRHDHAKPFPGDHGILKSLSVGDRK